MARAYGARCASWPRSRNAARSGGLTNSLLSEKAEMSPTLEVRLLILFFLCIACTPARIIRTRKTRLPGFAKVPVN